MGEHKRKLKVDFPDTNSTKRHLLATEKKFGENPIININWIIKNNGSKRIRKSKKGTPYSRKRTIAGAFGEKYKSSPWVDKIMADIKKKRSKGKLSV